MRAIWKYELEVTDLQEVEMPIDSQVLSVANQDGRLCMWALVPQLESRKEKYCFEIIGTGNPIGQTPLSRRFVGTVLMPPFVWHVFERVN